MTSLEKAGKLLRVAGHSLQQDVVMVVHRDFDGVDEQNNRFQLLQTVEIVPHFI